MIGYEIELHLTWSKDCIISVDKTANPAANSTTVRVSPTSATEFQINTSKCYSPIVTLIINDSIKFLKHFKRSLKRFKRTKHRSEVTK